MNGDSGIRVIKLGGSLLDFDGLVPQFRRWLAAQSLATNVVVVGGGRLADAIRAAFARHDLTEEAAHWLCVRLLGVTAELVHRLLPESRLVDRFGDLSSDGHRGRVVLFQTEHFLRREEPRLSPSPLPHNWAVTSDSIAARLAALTHAGELVLLKSGLPRAEATSSDMAQEGYVDRYFPQAVTGVPVTRCVNLRAGGFPELERCFGDAGDSENEIAFNKS